MKFIDSILNRITMYRLVVYELLFLLAVAIMLSGAGILAFSPMLLAFSVAILFAISWIANEMFAALFDAPSNPESTWITALILALIITPPHSFFDATYLPLAFWASSLAIASKYIFAIRKKHVFNPAAFGIAGTSLFLSLSASWWVGTPWMVPFVLLGGLAIVRKIHRFDLWWSFIVTFFLGVLGIALMANVDVGVMLERSFFYAPAFFFATVMLTEPMTTPPTRFLRMMYGGLVAVLFLPNINFSGFYLTPELALLIGNILVYLVSPKRKLVLTFKEKIRLSRDVFEFVFTSDQPLRFRAGQYLEWTLAHKSADSRGIRRYFTIASAPSEKEIRLGVKFYNPASTYKRALFNLKPGDTVIASQLAGDFTLPQKRAQKIVMIAGGIGITPFRSQLQDLLDRGERRDITLLYANKQPEDAVYRELLDRVRQSLGVKTVYAFTDAGAPLPNGAVRAIDAGTITREIPDYRERTFYISGPQGMVTAYKDMLQQLGVARTSVHTDYFPGFA